jgi:hypothetical protein
MKAADIRVGEVYRIHIPRHVDASLHELTDGGTITALVLEVGVPRPLPGFNGGAPRGELTWHRPMRADGVAVSWGPQTVLTAHRRKRPIGIGRAVIPSRHIVEPG